MSNVESAHDAASSGAECGDQILRAGWTSRRNRACSDEERWTSRQLSFGTPPATPVRALFILVPARPRGGPVARRRAMPMAFRMMGDQSVSDRLKGKVAVITG